MGWQTLRHNSKILKTKDSVRSFTSLHAIGCREKCKIIVPLSQIEKSQALEFILHVADISNPAKDWELHRQWTSRIMEEFFCQVCKFIVFILSSFLFFFLSLIEFVALSNSKL